MITLLIVMAVIFCLLVGLIILFIFRKLDGTLPRNERFPDRDELSPDEFYQQYYESSGLPKDQVIEILNYIARELEMLAGLIRPTDRFEEELKPDPLNDFDDGIAYVEEDMCILFHKKGMQDLSSDMFNVDNYIRYTIEQRQMESKPDNTAKCNPKYDTTPESDSINPLIVIAAIVVYIILHFLRNQIYWQHVY